ncbi:MAG: IS4 family transposase [Planctomycetota bacterium]|nr:IS4 family transposase [Planctomycetota bacterium]
MDGSIWANGRELSPTVLARIAKAVETRPELSRTTLARDVCAWLDWTGHDGAPKVTSCRIALRNLERRGLIDLPEAKGGFAPSTPRVPGAPPASPIICSLDELGALSVVAVTRAQRDLHAQWTDLMAHHYLGPGPLVGRQVRYLVGSDQGWVGALAFSAAAWAVAARDHWIGWSPAARAAHLQSVVANSRFFIPPWVQVPHLASKALARCCRQLPAEWQRRYGYAPVLLETYVDPARFAGTCYRAANWQRIGQTSGRGREVPGRARPRSIKDIYALPLAAHWRASLCRDPHPRPTPSRLPHAPRDWAEEEFGGASLGDARRTARLLTLARSFYARPQASIPQACGDLPSTKAAYRWMASEHVEIDSILQPHYEATTRRIAQHPVVLAVQDTTSFTYTSHRALDGVGPIGSRADGPQGLLMHDTMAYTPQGVPLGLVNVQVWARDPELFGKKHVRAALPIELKESHKWLASFRAAAAVQAQCPNTRVVSVGDREADLYELFVEAQRDDAAPQLLVRAEQDRLVDDGPGHLWATLEQQGPCATQLVEVHRTPTATDRTARLEVRFAAVELQPPRRKKRLPPVPLWAVLAREVDAPAEGVTPLEWMLLTTVPVTTADEALERLAWYTRRWGIEVYHKAIKSGCRIEARQLATVPRLENCLAIDLVVAWRIVHLMMLGRDTPELPCTIFFDDHEWKALYAFIARDPHAVPDAPPSLREVTRTVARLGGFLGRTQDGDPGIKTLWLGLQQLDTIAVAWRAFGPDRSNPP